MEKEFLDLNSRSYLRLIFQHSQVEDYKHSSHAKEGYEWDKSVQIDVK